MIYINVKQFIWGSKIFTRNWSFEVVFWGCVIFLSYHLFILPFST